MTNQAVHITKASAFTMYALSSLSARKSGLEIPSARAYSYFATSEYSFHFYHVGHVMKRRGPSVSVNGERYPSSESHGRQQPRGLTACRICHRCGSAHVMNNTNDSIQSSHARNLSSTLSGFFSQNMYVFCSPKSLDSPIGRMSNANSSRAKVSLMIAQASFCPIHLCRPSKKGSKASSLSSGKGDSARKRSGMNEVGSVKFVAERKVGYWFTDTKV